ncbi:MAG: 16S rRNA (uracil(1498)-N(3))-methyltransferase [Fimbriimonadaceae bacterium]|nr:16S rRNA (uracil(1498)-N(3))-methyltransferase [Fimbriimonadaceae bacterium]
MFVPVPPEAQIGDVIELPREEVDKLRKVLRLGAGALIVLLAGDGRVFRATFTGQDAELTGTEKVETEAAKKVTLAQSLPKPDKLDEVIRMGTEMGVFRFVLFPSERSVVKWDKAKVEDRLRRLRAIAREAAEVSFRTRIPEISLIGSLAELLQGTPDSLVLSEFENVGSHLRDQVSANDPTIVIGPEGGWAPREVALIGDRAVTLGPRVLRVDTAAAAAIALAVL